MNSEELNITELTCKRCEHTWVVRTKNIPLQCPKCHNAYWNREKVNKREV